LADTFGSGRSFGSKICSEFGSSDLQCDNLPSASTVLLTTVDTDGFSVFSRPFSYNISVMSATIVESVLSMSVWGIVQVD